MATTGRLILGVFVALIITLGLGFAWGVSGRMGLQASLDDARRDYDLAEGRAQILDARVSLYNNNFGDASRRLEDAKATLRRVRERYQEAGRNDAASSIDAALMHVEEAQRLAGKLDPAANSKAGDALESIKVARAKS